MEIVADKALLVRTRNPNKITQVIPKSQITKEVTTPNGKGYEVLVHWSLPNAKILQNLGFKKIPSPIIRHYKWPGMFKPFDHQKTTAEFLTLNQRAYCLNDMGTGKTMSVIWAADYLMTKGYIRRVLIVCPLSIMDSAWRADLFKTVMHRRVDIAHGTPEKRRKVIASDAEFVIINYDGIGVVHKEIAAGGFDLIVCDEASALKTAGTDRWKLMNQLVKPSSWLWLLTGTPAAQSPLDAYGLVKIMTPSAVPSHVAGFRDRVMLKVSTFKYVPKPEASQVVRDLLQPAIRYTKEECLDLPDIIYTEREVPLTPQQEKYYKLLKKEMLFYAAGNEVSAVNAAVQMNKLLQISAGAAYSDTGEVIEFDCSARLKEMTEVIGQSSHKVLVFANFKHSIDTIRAHLDKYKITNDVIHGGISANKRTAIFNEFQTKPDPHVLIIQPQAASHGVTLHAANTIIWWGPITSTETYLQANARVHRAGQRNPCTVVHLTGSAVEHKLYSSLMNKTEAHDSLLKLFKEELGIA